MKNYKVNKMMIIYIEIINNKHGHLLNFMTGIEVTHSLDLVRTMKLKAPLLTTMATPVLSSLSPPLEKRNVLSFNWEQRTRNEMVKPVMSPEERVSLNHLN